jgi:hypothetical protein
LVTPLSVKVTGVLADKVGGLAVLLYTNDVAVLLVVFQVPVRLVAVFADEALRFMPTGATQLVYPTMGESLQKSTTKPPTDPSVAGVNVTA